MADTPEAAVAKAQAAFEAAQAAVDGAQAELQAAQAALDAVIEERDGTPHPHQDQIDRMLYIQSQAEQRAARFGVMRQITEGLPVDPASLDARSTLDQAMKGSRRRGQTRPAKQPAKE